MTSPPVYNPAMRGHGEGSLYLLRTGRYAAAVSLPGGRRATRTCPHRHEPGAKACPEVKQLLRDLKRERDEGGTRGRRTTVGAYLASWVQSVRADLAPATSAKYEQHVRLHLAPALGRIRLADLTPSDVDAYLRRADLDPQTLRHHRATLSTALRAAQRDGLVRVNAASLSRPPKLRQRERAVLTAAQARALVDGTRAVQLGPLHDGACVKESASADQGNAADEPARRHSARPVGSDAVGPAGGAGQGDGTRVGAAAAPPVAKGDCALPHEVGPDRLHALWVLLVTTGLREAEALGLTWEDVDLGSDGQRAAASRAGGRAVAPPGNRHIDGIEDPDAQSVPRGPSDAADRRRDGRLPGDGATASVTVRHTLHRVGGEWQLRDPKTAKSARAVILPPITADALRAHRARQLGERMAAGRPGGDSLVFTTPAGRPMHGANLAKELRRHTASLGLPDVRVHDLRHGFATMLIQDGVPIVAVSRMLGHSSIRITVDTYTEAIPELERAASDRMQEMVG